MCNNRNAPYGAILLAPSDDDMYKLLMKNINKKVFRNIRLQLKNYGNFVKWYIDKDRKMKWSDSIRMVIGISKQYHFLHVQPQ